MRSKGPVLFLLVAVLLAAAAAWGARLWMHGRAAQLAATKVATAPVVVAARDLPPGLKLSPRDLTIASWPISSLPKGFYRSPVQLRDRVTRRPVLKGEVMLSTALAAKGVAGGLSAVVPAGFRAMTVKVDQVIGVAGFLQAGDRVDVLATVSQGPFRNNPVTSTVLQDVEVLASGTKVEMQRKGGKTKSKAVKVVTLKLNPMQSKKLAMATNQGNVILALRNQGDRLVDMTKVLRLNALMGLPPYCGPMCLKLRMADAAKKKAKQKAEKEAKGKKAKQVEVIRGVKRGMQNL